MDLNDNSKMILNQTDKGNKKINSEYNIYILNDLEYTEALKLDKRTLFQYYTSLLKERHALFFSFCRKNDFNSRIIKIFLFFYSFIIYLFVNTLFFSDSTMHKIYVDVGSYDFIYQLPQIIYSSLISIVLNIIVRALALTDNNIIDLINTKFNLEEKKKELINFLFYKFISFFVLSFCLLLFFWYYISCFCTIYVNTQIHLIKDTLISFGISLIYPLIMYLLSAIFRIISLRERSKNGRNFYDLSHFIQLFI